MDNLSPKELDYQYSKINTFLKQHESKYKKYKRYKSQLHSHITKLVKQNSSLVHEFPSLQIDLKKQSRAPLSENLIKDFFFSMYDSKQIGESIMNKFNEFREKQSSECPPSVSITSK